MRTTSPSTTALRESGMPPAAADGAMPRPPDGKRSHERSRRPRRPDADEPALRRQDQVRQRVPRAGGWRQEAMPHARRRTGIGRPDRKPERAQARTVQRKRNRREKADTDVAGRGAQAARGDDVIFSPAGKSAGHAICGDIPRSQGPTGATIRTAFRGNLGTAEKLTGMKMSKAIRQQAATAERVAATTADAVVAVQMRALAQAFRVQAEIIKKNKKKKRK